MPVTTAVSAALLRFAKDAGLVTRGSGVIHKLGRPLFCYADRDKKRTAAMVFVLAGLCYIGLHLRGAQVETWLGVPRTGTEATKALGERAAQVPVTDLNSWPRYSIQWVAPGAADMICACATACSTGSDFGELQDGSTEPSTTRARHGAIEHALPTGCCCRSHGRYCE